MSNKPKITENKVEGPSVVEVDCKMYIIFIKRRKYFLYEYNNGSHLDYVVRNAAGRIVERHTSDYIEVGKAFTDSSE